MTIRSNSRHQFSVPLSASPEDWKTDACNDECKNFADKCRTMYDDYGKELGVENCTTKTMCYEGCMKGLEDS